MTAYQRLQDAITKARQHHMDWCCSTGCTGIGICPDGGCEGVCNCYVGWLDGWLDTLEWLMDLSRTCSPVMALSIHGGVERALRKMGALND